MKTIHSKSKQRVGISETTTMNIQQIGMKSV